MRCLPRGYRWADLVTEMEGEKRMRRMQIAAELEREYEVNEQYRKLALREIARQRLHLRASDADLGADGGDALASTGNGSGGGSGGGEEAMAGEDGELCAESFVARADRVASRRAPRQQQRRLPQQQQQQQRAHEPTATASSSKPPRAARHVTANATVLARKKKQATKAAPGPAATLAAGASQRSAAASRRDTAGVAATAKKTKARIPIGAIA